MIAGPDLSHFDVVSAVSGGSYALAWYYWQLAVDEKKTILDRWAEIDRLERESDFVNRGTYVSLVTLDLLMTPINVFLNGVFGLHANTTPSRPWYEHRIREIFLGGRTLRFEDTRGMLKERKAPVPVINATVYIDDDRNYHGAKFANSVFEFTPFWYGSDAFGYSWNYPEEIDMGRATSISGAALDSSTIAGSAQKTLSSLLNQDLGMYIRNYGHSATVPDWKKMLPFPGYMFTDRYLRAPKGESIYLTDGGHSDNLGVFSLVRRQCSRIVVVDGEHDPEYRFGSYFKLKDSLKRELGLDLVVDRIEKTRGRARWCRYVGVGAKCVEAPGDPNRDTKQETWAWESLDGVAFYADPESVMEGTIRHFPRVSNGRVHGEEVKIAYIKLSLDPRRIDEYPEASVQEYYRTSLKKHRKQLENGMSPSGCLEKDGYWKLLWTGCIFPQESTTDQAFSHLQFRAYRELGSFVTCRAHKRIEEVLGVPVSADTSCR
jgi:hypothetical protein